MRWLCFNLSPIHFPIRKANYTQKRGTKNRFHMSHPALCDSGCAIRSLLNKLTALKIIGSR